MPDIAGVIHDGTVGGEDAGVGDVHQAHTVPGLLLLVQFLHGVLGTAVILEVSQDHVRVRVAQVVGNLAEVLTVPALFQHIQNCHGNIIIRDECLRMVAHAFQCVDFGSQHTKDDLVVLTGGIGDFHVRAVQGAQGDCAVQHELHVAGAGSLLGGKADLLGQVAGRDQLFSSGNGRYYFTVRDGWGVEDNCLYALSIGAIKRDFQKPVSIEEIEHEINNPEVPKSTYSALSIKMKLKDDIQILKVLKSKP